MCTLTALCQYRHADINFTITSIAKYKMYAYATNAEYYLWVFFHQADYVRRLTAKMERVIFNFRSPLSAKLHYKLK